MIVGPGVARTAGVNQTKSATPSARLWSTSARRSPSRRVGLRRDRGRRGVHQGRRTRAPDTRLRVLVQLPRHGSTEAGRQVSGGERNRVTLAQHAQVWRHSIAARRCRLTTLTSTRYGRLEAGLESFPGRAVVISHDRWFLSTGSRRPSSPSRATARSAGRGQLHPTTRSPASGVGGGGGPNRTGSGTRGWRARRGAP